ncbi:unnamed protein product [Arabis nemorensis]|uniref:BHLH domain-containing protein n=1 Tax=Arabis nemorensis TaxID=586526 RepID=A0A565ANY2_9BRAS|nr:unnamed protein product [Arabis nemorensis]
MESIYPVTNNQSRRKQKKKPPPSRLSLQKWRSEKQQQIYSTNIIQSLRKLRINDAEKTDPSPSLPRRDGGKAVRDAAYRSLAVTARGKTLWSRAILSKSVKLSFRKRNRSRIGSITGNNRLRKNRATVLTKGLPVVQRKVKLLSRLIPGCRKQSFPVVLEETTDYIVAMEMQIRALNAIISVVGSGSSSTAAPPPDMGHGREDTHMFG